MQRHSQPLLRTTQPHLMPAVHLGPTDNQLLMQGNKPPTTKSRTIQSHALPSGLHLTLFTSPSDPQPLPDVSCWTPASSADQGSHKSHDRTAHRRELSADLVVSYHAPQQIYRNSVVERRSREDQAQALQPDHTASAVQQSMLDEGQPLQPCSIIRRDVCKPLHDSQRQNAQPMQLASGGFLNELENRAKAARPSSKLVSKTVQVHSWV